MIEEDGVGNSESDGTTSDLSRRNETDSKGNHARLDLCLGDGERSLDKRARANCQEDAVTIDVGCGRLGVDGVHESCADYGQDTAEDVPREVVASGTHYGAVSNAEDHKEDHEGQKSHTGFERRIRVHELEEERDEVDWKESRGAAGSSFGEEDTEELVLKEWDWEYTAFDSGEQGEALLDAEEDEENTGADEETNDTAAIPGV